MKKRTKLAWKMGLAGAILAANTMAMANIRLEPEYLPTASMDAGMDMGSTPVIETPKETTSVCKPMLTFYPEELQVEEDFSRRFGDIDVLTKQSTLQQTSSGQGVGVVQTSFSWRPSFATINGCPSVQVRYGFQNTKLYVANDLTANQCAFQQVLLHERRHVEIYKEWLKSSQERLNAAFKDRAKDVLGDKSMSTEAMNEAEKTIKAAIQEEFKVVQKTQEEHDSPEEYAHNDRECNRAIPRLLKRAGFAR